MPVAIESPALHTAVSASTKSAKMDPVTAPKSSVVDIIDIRSAAVELNLKQEIHNLLKPKQGPRQLPTLLLYNEQGLQIFEEVILNTDYTK